MTANQTRTIAGLVILILLAAGVYFADSAYSQTGKKEPQKPSVEKPKPGKDDPNLPINLLKTADKIMENIDETKDAYALVTHSELMCKKAAEIMALPRQAIETILLIDKKTDKSKMMVLATNYSMLETAEKLLAKSVELMAKYDELIPESTREMFEKQPYQCPNECMITHRAGKCMICNADLIKR